MTFKITKKNNPLKMWGSYAGAIIGFIFPVPHILGGTFSAFRDVKFSLERGQDIFGVLHDTVILVTIMLTIGFLIGWGLHLFARKQKWVK